MLSISISNEAIDDLKQIYHYLADVASERIAEKLLRTIERKFYTLALAPYSGRLREDILPQLRQSLTGKYLIFYVPTSTEIKIIRVLHANRDYERMMKR